MIARPDVTTTKRAGWVAACVLAVTPGCVSPENSPLWSPDWDRRLAEADRQAPDLPAEPRPEPLDDAAWLGVDLADDGPLELSLEAAATLALRHNRDLAVQQLNPVVVGTFELLERGVFDPEAFAEFEYGKETASETDRGTGDQFAVESDDIAAVAGVRQALPTGTDVELSVAQARDNSNRAPEQQDARLGLTVTQQLLRGAGPAVNLARIRQAQFDTRASVHELRGYVEALLADVEQGYWQLALAGQRIQIFEESLEVARSQRDHVEQRIDIGVLPSVDGAVARAEVARREQALIDATSQLEAQRLRLLRLINPPRVSLDRPVSITTPVDIVGSGITDVQERVTLAELRRPDLAEARLRLEQNRLETIITRNGVLPRLEVFVALGKTGFGDRFDDSFNELDGETYDLAAGVRFSQLLGNDAARGADLNAYASRRQAAAAIENLRQLIDLEVRLAVNELERARRQIDASTLTRQLQEDTVRAERERYAVGASTALLVAQAQRDLLEAQIVEVEAVVAYRLARIDLYLAEGTLLDRRGYTVATPD